jgi:hypothetical protein
MKPSDAIREGKCPGCLGEGWVTRFVPYEHDGPCSMCLGDGKWPPDAPETLIINAEISAFLEDDDDHEA